jgi:hypothetical protein
MTGLAIERSNVESRAVDRCFYLERKYSGALDARRTAELMEEIGELVPLGRYVGLLGLIRVTRLSYVPEGGTFADILVEWKYDSGEEGESVGVIHFLEYYRQFEPHLI